MKTALLALAALTLAAVPVQAADLTCKFVAGGPDVNGQTFQLTQVGPSLWQGSFTCTAGNVSVTLNVASVTPTGFDPSDKFFQWSARGNAFQTSHKAPGPVIWSLYSRDRTLMSFGTFTVN